MPFHWFESIQIGNDINYYTVLSRTQPSFHFRTLLLNDLHFALSVYFPLSGIMSFNKKAISEKILGTTCFKQILLQSLP